MYFFRIKYNFLSIISDIRAGCGYDRFQYFTKYVVTGEVNKSQILAEENRK